MNKVNKPKVLFAIGDADWKYTRGKFQKLVRRVAATEQLTSASLATMRKFAVNSKPPASKTIVCRVIICRWRLNSRW